MRKGVRTEAGGRTGRHNRKEKRGKYLFGRNEKNTYLFLSDDFFLSSFVSSNGCVQQGPCGCEIWRLTNFIDLEVLQEIL